MELTKAEIKLLRKAYSVMADTHRKYHPESGKDISEFENKFEPIPSEYRYLLKEFGGCHFVDPWNFTLEELGCELIRIRKCQYRLTSMWHYVFDLHCAFMCRHNLVNNQKPQSMPQVQTLIYTFHVVRLFF